MTLIFAGQFTDYAMGRGGGENEDDFGRNRRQRTIRLRSGLINRIPERKSKDTQDNGPSSVVWPPRELLACRFLYKKRPTFI
jgi:hypothetical protein